MKKFLIGLTLLAVLDTTFPILGLAAMFTFFTECNECDGSGKCPNCHGIGGIIEEYYDENVGAKVEHNKGPCKVCKTTGKCQRCGGSGKIPIQ